VPAIALPRAAFLYAGKIFYLLIPQELSARLPIFAAAQYGILLSAPKIPARLVNDNSNPGIG
jgi:hypothetical protein